MAYAAAAHTLNATTPLGLARVGDAVWRATFACPGRSELVVAWWADTANQAVELSDTTPSGTWHDSLFQPLEPDELRIPVGRLPVYTVWPLPEDGKEPEFLARIRAVSATPVHVSSVFVAGRNRLGLAVANNTGQDLTLDVRCGSEKATVALSGLTKNHISATGHRAVWGVAFGHGLGLHNVRRARDRANPSAYRSRTGTVAIRAESAGV